MAIGSFIYQSSPQRVVFGAATLARLPEEAARLGLKHILVLSTEGHWKQAEDAGSLLGSACAGVFAGARMHTPVEITAQAMAVSARKLAPRTPSYLTASGCTTSGRASRAATPGDA